MKHTLSSLLLTSLFVVTTHVRCMDPYETWPLARMVLESSQENCTQRECKAGSAAFTLSAIVGGAIAFPVCSALSAPVGIAALATLGSGFTGTMAWMCCHCIKTDNP
jgi:hypothetical protein